MLKQVSSYQPSGKHNRPEDKKRLAKLVKDLDREDLFTFTPGRYFSAHPAFPRDVLLWLDRPRYTAWVEKYIMELGGQQESGTALAPKDGFKDISLYQLMNYKLYVDLLQIPSNLRTRRYRTMKEKAIAKYSSKAKLIRAIYRLQNDASPSAILAYCTRQLPPQSGQGRHFVAGVPLRLFPNC